ncbi:MAG: acylphosphatase [Candidatus Omnitrophota bacterium]
MKKQLHLIYSGRVQGIGFRYTVADRAKQQGLVGWVRNLDDLRVEIVAEAKEDALNRFLQDVNQHFSGYISEVKTEWLPAAGQFRDFQIVF